MHDVVVSGGLVIDGTGAKPFTADVAVTDGRVTAVGTDLGEAKQVIDADGALVTPGWVDVHTHYDGQVTWDDEIAPSNMNGVTTVVTGNCGVGFAPVAPGAEQTLIELMEGVEDIPGSALATGIPWGEWESFGDYLDHLDTRSYSLDIGTQIAHGALRFYVMGERGRHDVDATHDEIATQARLVTEALRAGALGFTTSRTIGHRSLHGEAVPGTFAADEELLAIAVAMKELGQGVFEAIPAGVLGPLESMGGERSTLLEEVDLLRRFSVESNRPVTFTLLPSTALPSDEWVGALAAVEEANRNGAQLRPQVPSRPVSVVSGLSTYHAFMRKPFYLEHLAGLSLAKRVEQMRKPEVRRALMDQDSIAPAEPGSMENLYGLLTRAAGSMVAVDDPADYLDPAPVPFEAIAQERGCEAIDVLYDFLLEEDGTRFARLAPADPVGNRAALRTLMTHDASVFGLSDAGAHVTMICDGTMPTTMLMHWGRNCPDDLRIPLEVLVHKQSLRNAELYGLSDRGSVEPGKRADINVIDLDRLSVAPPVPHHDLPANGMRLIQPVQGYVASLCNGIVTRRNDEDTGARPGRLVRSGRL